MLRRRYHTVGHTTLCLSPEGAVRPIFQTAEPQYLVPPHKNPCGCVVTTPVRDAPVKYQIQVVRPAVCSRNFHDDKGFPSSCIRLLT